MIERRIVRRYASALFSAASKANAVDQVESDLGLVSYVFEASPKLTESARSPLVPASKKKEILKDIFGGKVHELTLSYLDLLVDKRREDAIAATEAEYVLLANEARGIVLAHVSSAVELTPQERKSLASAISDMTGKKAQLDLDIDAELIGGVLVRIGDTVIDGSIRGQLGALRVQLLS